jgi:ABC-type antimicrobial peptide transport system permease subunit
MFLWHRDSLAQRGRPVTFWGDGPILLLSYLVAVFVVSLGAAIFSAVVVNYIGALIGVGDHIARGLGEIPARTAEHVGSYLIGLPIALAILWFTVLQPGGLVNRILTPWCLDRAAPNARHE